MGTIAGTNNTVVAELRVISGGSNYTSAPRVDFTYNCAIPPSATAYIISKDGVVAAVMIVAACVTPGGNSQDRAAVRGWREENGMSGDGFATLRGQMTYGNDYRCGWRIKPPVPEGYKLRFKFHDFNTEQGYDVVSLIDGEADELDSTDGITVGGGLPGELSELPVLLTHSGTSVPSPKILSLARASFSSRLMAMRSNALASS
jgi:hypothetical protein